MALYFIILLLLIHIRYIITVARLQADSKSSMTSADDTPPTYRRGYWSTTPPSSCGSTPPVRPRLPKHFKPTPFLPMESDDIKNAQNLVHSHQTFTESSKPPFSPRPQRKIFLSGGSSFSSEDGGSEKDKLYSKSPEDSSKKVAPLKKSKGLKLFRKMQKKLQSLGLPGI